MHCVVTLTVLGNNLTLLGNSENPDHRDSDEAVDQSHTVFHQNDGGSSAVECLTRDRGPPGLTSHWRHSVVPLSKNINPSLELVQPRKSCSFITERLLMERKESNQTIKVMGSYQ